MKQAVTEIWDAEERQAWRPEQPLKPSQWAETYRVLGQGQSDRPGPWRNDNAPYLRGLMDLAIAPGVVQINIMKAGQIGVSEALRNVIGYWAHREPDPIGLGLPDQAKGRKIVSNRIIPLIFDTEPLKELLTTRAWDIQSEQIKLVNGLILHLMWAGSPSATSADPMRRVINDEVDKFQQWAGKEPDPVGRTWTRLRSYGDRKLQINVSTPTTRLGAIHNLFDKSTVQLEYYVPCSICGKYQKLVFAQLKWETKKGETDKETAARVMRDNSVWYQCIHCDQKILPDEKSSIIRQGIWRSIDGKIKNAETVKKWPRGTRLGIHVSALYCLWESWTAIAAQFLRAKGDPEAMYNFCTETLGEVWEMQAEKTTRSVYSKKCQAVKLEEGVVPKWAVKLLATIDTQHNYFWLVLRAWGSGMKSQRVWHGRVETFAELDNLCFKQPWPVQDKARLPIKPELILIDSGGTKLAEDEASRTLQVYKWALERRARVRAIKGASKTRGGIFIWPGKGLLDDGRRKDRRTIPQLRIWFLYTHHFRDLLADLITRGIKKEDKQPEVWLLNKRDDDEYNSHLSNIHKILVRNRQGNIEERWIPRESGARIDLADCEAYQVAAAYMAQVHLLPSEAELEKYQETMKQEMPAKPKQQSRRKGSSWDVRSAKDYL